MSASENELHHVSGSITGKMLAYFKRAKTWDADLVAERDKSRRMAWIVACVAVVVAVTSIGADFFRAQKVVRVPFLIRVDASTGIVDTVTQLQDGKSTYDERTNKYWVEKYIQCRESYERVTFAEQYNVCALFTPENKRASLRSIFDFEKSSSLFARYGDRGSAKVLTRYKTFIAGNTVQVHYLLKEYPSGGDEKLSYWVATLEFEYVGFPEGEAAQKINPLGFQVVSYRTDQEVVQ